MLIAVGFMASIALLIGFWLRSQRLASKPWLEQGLMDDVAPKAVQASRTGLGVGVLIVVMACLFALLFSAYLMRSGLADWVATPTPRLLWLNTALLAWSSIALQAASDAARRDQFPVAMALLTAGAVSALVFIVAQVALLGEFTGGALPTSSPASAFLWLITAIHGAHLLGGIVALGRTGALAFSAENPGRARAAIGLCAIYWHFLLAVWLVFVWLLSDAGTALADFCRRVISQGVWP